MARPRSLRTVVAEGEYLPSLERIRDGIAADLDACDSFRDKAALYLRMADVLQRIEDARPALPKGDAVDEITQRRASRRSGTATG